MSLSHTFACAWTCPCGYRNNADALLCRNCHPGTTTTATADGPKRLEESRAKDYGDPEGCHDAIAQCWAAYLDRKVSSMDKVDVALMMCLVKIVRAAHGRTKDSFDDAEVYLRFARRFAGHG